MNSLPTSDQNRRILFSGALCSYRDKDIEGYHIYSFAALSRGLCNIKEHRQYATVHFREIRHSELKLFWAVMLFNEGNPSTEITCFLKNALKSEAQLKLLGQISGPNFTDFRARVIAAKTVIARGAYARLVAISVVCGR